MRICTGEVDEPEKAAGSQLSMLNSLHGLVIFCGARASVKGRGGLYLQIIFRNPDRVDNF